MKKLVLVLVFALFSITAINAEETENKSNNEATTETSINAPIYWQGWAKKGSLQLYLTVYQSNGMCNSYYAIASEFRNSYGRFDIEPVVELVVKEGSRSGYYYVTYKGTDYSFSM